MTSTSPSFQRLSTSDRDYLFPSLGTLIEDRANGTRSFVRVSEAKVIENEYSRDVVRA